VASSDDHAIWDVVTLAGFEITQDIRRATRQLAEMQEPSADQVQEGMLERGGSVGYLRHGLHFGGRRERLRMRGTDHEHQL
jgi:hypothetical protein